MPSEIRRRAKAINFGIIYGISAFGLANQLGIARNEAGDYIRKYFERFPGIRDYMEATKKIARANGYVTTLFGRKCHYPRINASNPSERAFNERAAINAPLQGSAADIIRRAMVRMDDALDKAGLSAQMLLTVHDELVFEAPDDEIEATLAGRGEGDGGSAGAGGQIARAAESRRARGAELGRGALACQGVLCLSFVGSSLVIASHRASKDARPSGRALAKQSRGRRPTTLGLLRRCAPRNDGCA